MDILVVEDADKTSDAVLKAFGIDPRKKDSDRIHVKRTRNEAEVLLNQLEFDFIFIDSHLPKSPGKQAEMLGIEMLKLIEGTKRQLGAKVVFYSTEDRLVHAASQMTINGRNVVALSKKSVPAAEWAKLCLDIAFT